MKALKIPSRIIWAAALLAVMSAIAFLRIPQASSTPRERTFELDARRFSYSPGVISVNPGDQVTIKLISSDVVHGLSIDNYDFTLTTEPGQSATGSFIPDRSGVFRFRCTVTCGNLHPFMIGELKVGENPLWMRGILTFTLALLAALVVSKPGLLSRPEPLP